MLKKIFNILLTGVLTVGIVFSNGPFWIVSQLLDSYAVSHNIVDKAWHVSRDPNVVDSFNSLRHVADKIRIQEAHAAVTYQSASAVANSNIVVVGPAYPASISQGDLLVMIVGMKPSTANSGSIGAAPEGWTAITSGSLVGAGGYSTTLGADTGNTNVFSYYKIAEGNESSAVQPVRLVTNNVSWAQIYRFTNSTEDWSLAATTGSDATGDTSVSVAMSADPGVASGDHILAAMVIPTDVSTPSQFSGEALTQTGITFGTVTEISEPDTTTGNDMGGFVVRSSVSSGTSSAAPTLSGTAGGTTTNVRGPGIFIRIRATGTITYQSAGAVAISAAVVGICPAHPASIGANDLLVTVIGMKPSTANSGSITTPAGWTAVTNGSLVGAGGYSTTLGADTGNTNVFSFYRLALGTEVSERCFLRVTSNVAWAQMYRLSNDSDLWDVVATTGSDTSGDSSVSIAMSADPGVTTGDHILGAMVIPTDVSTPNQFSSESFTQTGVTFGTVTEINEPDTTTGNDMGGFTVRSSVSSGTGSAAPTMIATAAGTVTNVRGPGIFIRIRETSSVPTVTTQAASSITTTAATLNGNITSTGGNNATVRGFAWGTNSSLSGGDTATTTENGSFGTGAFTGSLSSLTCNTTYYSRAYATNPAGTSVGSIQSFATSACSASLTFIVTTDVFPPLIPGTYVFATSTLSVDTDNSAGWNVTVSRDDANTTLDLTTDASVNITDQTAWVPGADTTQAGNAVRLSLLDSLGDVLAFRMMTASGTASFISTAWWGNVDAYIDNASSFWSGLPSSSQQIGNSSQDSGGVPVLNTVLYYLDVPSTQKTGTYDGGVTFTATMN